MAISDNAAALSNDILDVYRQLKTHKRYTLRTTAVAAIIFGSIFNFASFVCAMGGYDGAPRYLTFWASITLGISFLWNIADLGLHSNRIFQNKQFLSLNALVLVDTVGFLSYLALLIANGIIVDHLYNGPQQLYVYNSVPWMVCCVVHGLIALQSVYGTIINIGYGSTCCPDCGRKAKNAERRSSGGVNRSLLGSDNNSDGYEDLEAGPGDA